jgi:hypothetical protein
MRATGLWTAALSAVLLLAGRPGDAGAAVDVLTVAPAPAARRAAESGCAQVGGALSADESRVVDWLVEQILDLEADGAPAAEFTEAAVQAATGVQVAGLDAERVRRHVRARLKSGTSARPAADAAPAPAPRDSAAGSSSGCSESRSGRSTSRASIDHPQGAPSAP